MRAYPVVMPQISCRTHFDAPPPAQPPFLTDPASNSPEYNQVWYSPTLNVLYCPRTVTITPSASEVMTGDVLTCSSDGFPTPQYEWENLVTGERSNGPTLIVNVTGFISYRCTARSVINGNTCAAATTVSATALDLKYPQNQAEVVGEELVFTCRQRTQQIIWLFAPVGTTSSVSIVNNCRPIPGFDNKYGVDSGDFNCNLIIHNITSAQAGTYTCQDSTSTDLPVSAQLTALGSEPYCWSNTTDDFVLHGQEVRYSCIVNYSGNIIPKMIWLDATQTNLDSAVVTQSDSFVESSITVTAVKPSIGPFMCRTYFDGPTFTPPDHISIATDAPAYKYNWTSAQLSVLGCPANECMNNATCVEDNSNGYVCICPPGYTGTLCDAALVEGIGDCQSLLEQTPSPPSGVYSIYVESLNKTVQVYCDMVTAGGGWTVFQRRKDGSGLFYRPWLNYADGFGDLQGEFWLGNDIIAALTSNGSHTLRVDLGDWAGYFSYAEYDNFLMASSDDNYRLVSVGNYFGDAGDSLSYHVSRMFTTYDQDHDGLSSSNCAELFHGAWWYHTCHESNLNGEYNNTEHSEGINWFSWRGYMYSLQFAEMKIR